MPDVEFGLPHLRRTGRVIKYELEGVAFIEGYEKTVGFTFECRGRNWSLVIEDLYQSKDVYNFFNKLFKNCLEYNRGISKSMLGLSAEWRIAEDKIQEEFDTWLDTYYNNSL